MLISPDLDRGYGTVSAGMLEYMQEAVAYTEAAAKSSAFRGSAANQRLYVRGDAVQAARYWSHFADYQGGRVTDEQSADARLTAMYRVAALTPAAIICSELCDSVQKLPGRTRHEAVGRTIDFGNELHGCIELFSGELTHSGMRAFLSSVMAVTAGLSAERRWLSEVKLNGVRHEIITKLFLQAAERTFRRGTVDEERRGRDFVVKDPNRNVGSIHVDVKSGVRSIKNRVKPSDTFGIDPDDGLVTMPTMVQNEAFNDGYSLKDTLVRALSPKYNSRLIEASGRLATLGFYTPYEP